MADIKIRNKWNRPAKFGDGSPVRKLAEYVKDKPEIALALCGKEGTFDDALTALLVSLPNEGPLEDLTDAERAFCAGWAYLAKMHFDEHKGGEDDDSGKATAICNAIIAHLSGADLPDGPDCDDGIGGMNG